MCNERIIHGTRLPTQKICTVSSINVFQLMPDEKARTQCSGWPSYGHWTPFDKDVLTKAPQPVSSLLRKIADNITQEEEWPIGVCAEVWCLLRGLELNIAPKDIRISQARGDRLLVQPCKNCSQWLEEDGSSRVYKIKSKFL